MLVRRAVLAARQRHALAGGALAGARMAAQRAAVERDPLALAVVHELGGDPHVAVDHPVDAHLLRHREEDAYVVEERPRRPREVVAVAREALESALPRLKEMLPILAVGAVAIGDDKWAELPIHGAAELVHTRVSLSL